MDFSRGTICFLAILLMVAQAVINHGAQALDEAGSNIYITSDSTLSTSPFVRSGSGTQLSPYIISDWDMDDKYIRIENTASYLVIRNITFSAQTSWAFYLANADNIVVRNVTSTGRGRFLYTSACSNILFDKCNVTAIPTQTYVVQVLNGMDFTISNSRFVNASSSTASIYYDNQGTGQRFLSNYLEGIPLVDENFRTDGYIYNSTFIDSPVTLSYGVQGSRVSKCDFNSPGQNALTLSNCRYMKIDENRFHGASGIYFSVAQWTTGSTLGDINGNIFESCNNGILSTSTPTNVYTSRWNVFNNYFGNCSNYAIEWGRGLNNDIWNNIFFHNKGTDNSSAGSQCDQLNYGSNMNRWTVDGEGNFWANHRTPDENTDGIVDDPYIISTGGSDDRPYTNPYFDTNPPSIQITAPTDLYPERSYITIYWQADDIGSGIERIDLRIDTGQWIDMTGRTFKSIFLKEGNHFVDVRATDRAGFINISRRQYILGDTVDVIDLISPMNNEYIPRSEIDIEWSLAEYFSTSNQTIVLDGYPHYLNINQRVFRPVLQEGPHSFQLHCKDLGGLTVSRSGNFTVDLTDPEVEILSPQDGSSLSNTLVSINYNVSDNLALGALQTRLDGGNWTDQNLDSKLFPALLDHGIHSVEVRGIDLSGRQTTQDVTFTIGATPLLRILSPPNGTSTNEDQITFKWTYSGPFSWDVALLRVGIAGEFMDIQGEEEVEIDLDREGEYEIILRLVDGFENFIESKIIIFKDTTAPVAGFIFPQDGSYVGSRIVPLSWKGTENNGLPISGYKLSVDGGPWMDMGLDEENELTLTEGAHTAALRAIDLAGNVGEKTISFIVDVTPPEAGFTSPINGTILTDSLVDFIFSANDGGGLLSLDISIDERINLSVLGTNQRSITIGTDGLHIVKMIAVDKAGNSAVSELHLIVDMIEPYIEWIIEPTGYSSLKNFTLSWNITEELGLSTLYLTVDGSIFDLDIGDREATLDLEEGTHIISITAVDLAGWRTELSSSDQIEIDLTPPIVQVDGYNSKVEGNSVKIHWSTTDGDGSGIGTALILLDGGEFETVQSEGMDEFTFEGLSVGEHKVTIRIIDRAGNFRDVDWGFEVVIEEEGGDGKDEPTDPIPIILGALGAFIIFLVIVVAIVLRRRRKEEEKINEARKGRLHKPQSVSIGLSGQRQSRSLPPEAKLVDDLPPTKIHQKVEETKTGSGYIRPKKMKGKKPGRVIEEKKKEEKIPSFMVSKDDRKEDKNPFFMTREEKEDEEFFDRKEKEKMGRPTFDEGPTFEEPLWDDGKDKVKEETFWNSPDQDVQEPIDEEYIDEEEEVEEPIWDSPDQDAQEPVDEEDIDEEIEADEPVWDSPDQDEQEPIDEEDIDEEIEADEPVWDSPDQDAQEPSSEEETVISEERSDSTEEDIEWDEASDDEEEDVVVFDTDDDIEEMEELEDLEEMDDEDEMVLDEAEDEELDEWD